MSKGHNGCIRRRGRESESPDFDSLYGCRAANQRGLRGEFRQRYHNAYQGIESAIQDFRWSGEPGGQSDDVGWIHGVDRGNGFYGPFLNRLGKALGIKHWVGKEVKWGKRNDGSFNLYDGLAM